MQNHCAVINCASGKSSDQHLFRFPKDAERCRKWAEKCHRKDLEDKSADHLYRYYRLCAKHFETSSVENNEDPHNIMLKDDAIPNIFDVASQVSQPQQQKQSKETTEDETDNIDKVKKKNTKARKVAKKDDAQTTAKKDDAQPTTEEDVYKQSIRSLFEALVLLGEQNIPLKGHAERSSAQENIASTNFQAMLEYRMNTGDEALQKMSNADPLNKECCTPVQLNQLIEVCEKSIREGILEEVKKNVYFSLITDDLVKVNGEWHLPVFLRYVDQGNCQQERFVGFLPFEGDGEALTERLLSDLSDKWGLVMENCRGQAHSYSSRHFGKIKAFATKLTEKYPMAILVPRSTCSLNTALASGMASPAVQLVLSTFKKIESFFSHSPSLQLELEHAIAIFYQDKAEKANELKEICRTSWTTRHDAFEVAVDIIESILLCVDSVHDNEDMRWSDQVTHDALEISKALADFEFVMALTVLKNIMSLTQAFGKKLQSKATDVYMAANSLQAVLLSLAEVSDNIDVYHEFWYDEAVNLASGMEIAVKVPRSVLRKHRPQTVSALQPESYYKEYLSIAVVNHVVTELKELFCENHLKALRCLLVIPAVVGQKKSLNSEGETDIKMYENDIPNAATLPAELHCWWVKWVHKGKGEDNGPSALSETLQLSDIKFFPNMLAVLRVIGTLPILNLESSYDVAYRRFKLYVENTPEINRSKGLSLLNINCDAIHDLDSMVETYVKTFPKENV